MFVNRNDEHCKLVNRLLEWVTTNIKYNSKHMRCIHTTWLNLMNRFLSFFSSLLDSHKYFFQLGCESVNLGLNLFFLGVHLVVHMILKLIQSHSKLFFLPLQISLNVFETTFPILNAVVHNGLNEIKVSTIVYFIVKSNEINEFGCNFNLLHQVWAFFRFHNSFVGITNDCNQNVKEGNVGHNNCSQEVEPNESLKLIFCNIFCWNVSKSQQQLLNEQAHKWVSTYISNKALILIDAPLWLILFAVIKYKKGIRESHYHKTKHKKEVANINDWALNNIDVEWKFWT